MNYKLEKNKITIHGKEDFNVSHILECGQIFAYEGNKVYSKTGKIVQPQPQSVVLNMDF